jgi:aspartokinase
MQKRILWGTVLLVIAVALLACGGGKYSDVIEVSNQFADVTEKYINAIEKAENSSAAADATNTYAGKIEKIAPRMREMADKYPELKDRNKVPEELKESRERDDAFGEKMAGAMMKVMMTYSKDPEVRKAQERLQKAMMLMMKK